MRTNTNRLLYLGITGNIYNSKSVAIHGSGSWQDQRGCTYSSKNPGD